MGQEFIIKSEKLESKFNSLVPSQGGSSAGIDLSANTQIIPIIDLTESASGSNLRQDLQTAVAYNSNTAFNVNSTTTTLINTTGFWRITGTISIRGHASIAPSGKFRISDGTTPKDIWGLSLNLAATGDFAISESFDLVFFVRAGELVDATASGHVFMVGSVRQIADLQGNLVNPAGFVFQ